MFIHEFVCGSCAVASIHDLGTQKDADSAMRYFCKNVLGVKSEFKKNYNTLTNYYIFCAGPEVKAGEPGSSHHSKEWVKYGTEFAEFIRDNRLGDVATVGPKPNIKHHKSTTAQVWAWSPDQGALEAWWTEAQKPKVTKPETPKPVKPRATRAKRLPVKDTIYYVDTF